MSEKIKISVVMSDEKPNVYKKEKSADALILTQEPGLTIMSILLQNRLMSGSFCGGRGDCGRCVIQFLEGAPLPTGMERARLTPEELRQGYRLACVARPGRDCTVRVMDEGDRSTPIVTEVNLPSENIDLTGRKNILSENQKSAAMEYEEEKETCLKKTQKKSSVISETSTDVMEFTKKDTGRENTERLNNQCYMIAVDLGTTTIAMQLRNLATDGVEDTYCEKNPQSIYGTDVLARIEASCNGKKAELQKLICEALLRGILQFTAYLRRTQDGEKAGSREQEEAEACILCMCVAGNTAMQHLLLGYDVEGLGKAPFVPTEKGLQKWFAAKLFPELYGARREKAALGLKESRDFPVYIAPCISAFVGGDIVAGLCALQMIPVFSGQKEEEQENGQKGAVNLGRKEPTTAALLIDLGTNGEMAITDGRRMIATATAAGPAFEGRGDLIGTDRIALTAALLRRGILDETGLMAEPYFEEGVPIELGEKGEAEGKTRQIEEKKNQKNKCYFRKEDVRALQMAKAAVRAGVEILWEEMGQPAIERVYLAGGFGYYLDVEAAIKIGLLPACMRGRVQAVGNTSLAGAYELGCALSRGEISGELLEKELSHIESINLAGESAFEGLYLKYMNLEEN